jgi:tRNA threonylcarbamoyladenosine biosynthesis protein TsaE
MRYRFCNIGASDRAGSEASDSGIFALMADREWVFDRDDAGGVPAGVLAACGKARVIALHGPMGAGKTTFVRHLCMALGVRDRVNSPTFSLVNEYLAADGSAVHHVDLYRVAGEEEAAQAGIEELLRRGPLSLVEWPERAPGILPEDARHLFISVLPDGRRRLVLTDTDGNR